MSCIDVPRRWRLALVALAALLASCSSRPPSPPGAGAGPLPRSTPPEQTAPDAGGVPPMAAPTRARDWGDFRRQAALRIVQANPRGSYLGTPPDPLLAIPVLEIELDARGGIRRMAVLRVPTQAKDTMQLAMEAVRRAAPFGPVDHLPGPWKFTEVFLFDDQRRFKPRTLDD